LVQKGRDAGDTSVPPTRGTAPMPPFSARNAVYAPVHLRKENGRVIPQEFALRNVNIAELETKTITELRDIARDLELSGYTTLKKQDLVFRLLQANTEQQGNIFSAGVLEIVEDGFGFLRQERFLPGNMDVYVSQSQIRRFGLRTGDMVIGQVRAPKDSEKYYGLLRVETVNGIDLEQAKKRPSFESLTPIFPDVRFDLETNKNILSPRLLNLIAPVGKGQRGLIVSPPKAGKTTVLKE